MQPEISQDSRNWPTQPIGKVRLLSTIFWGMRNGWTTGLFPPSSTPIRKWLDVGKTEEELKASGEYYNLVKIPMTYSGRFVAENETGNGLCKLLTNVNGQIIGCHLVGNPASEIIVIAGIAVEHGYTVDEFKKTVFPHPTVGEAIHESLYL